MPPPLRVQHALKHRPSLLLTITPCTSKFGAYEAQIPPLPQGGPERSRCSTGLSVTGNNACHGHSDTLVTCRYELWCIARAAAARYCVLQCSAPRETAEAWNAGRPAGEAYSEAVLSDLWSRYEKPDSRNRWDKPLFRLDAEKPEESSAVLQVELRWTQPIVDSAGGSQALRGSHSKIHGAAATWPPVTQA